MVYGSGKGLEAEMGNHSAFSISVSNFEIFRIFNLYNIINSKKLFILSESGLHKAFLSIEMLYNLYLYI
jgi:hypothetical protein